MPPAGGRGWGPTAGGRGGGPTAGGGRTGTGGGGGGEVYEAPPRPEEEEEVLHPPFRPGSCLLNEYKIKTIIPCTKKNEQTN